MRGPQRRVVENVKWNEVYRRSDLGSFWAWVFADMSEKTISKGDGREKNCGSEQNIIKLWNI